MYIGVKVMVKTTDAIQIGFKIMIVRLQYLISGELSIKGIIHFHFLSFFQVKCPGLLTIPSIAIFTIL